jgi:hypothetical protein
MVNLKLKEKTIKKKVPDSEMDQIVDLLISISSRIVEKEKIKKSKNEEGHEEDSIGKIIPNT